MKIGIASDHRGLETKMKIIKYLKNHEIIDLGTNSIKSVDYPEYAFKVGNLIQNNKIDLGILICGTGIGMSIAANKVKGVRCALVHTKEEAKLAKLHNNANVIALSSNTSILKIKNILEQFINTEFSTEERHNRRVEMIDDYND